MIIIAYLFLICQHQLNFLRHFWDISPLWNGYSAVATTPPTSSRSWLLEKQTTLALVVVIPQGFFSLRFYRLIYCARWFQFSFFGSNNDQLWLDESSEFSLDWNSVVLHWIRRVFGFVMITFYIYLPKNNLLKNVIQQLTLSYFFWHFEVCFDEIIELGTRNCCIKFLCLDFLSFLSIIFQKIF